MPQTLNEWLFALSVLAAAALWAIRVLVWVVRIHDQLQNLVGEYAVTKEIAKQNVTEIAKIKRELGLA